jgi:hypothetical protein
MRRRILVVAGIIAGIIALGLSVHVVTHMDWHGVIEAIKRMHG